MALAVLFQNHDLLVVDKPSGQSVHNVEDRDNLLLQVKQELGLQDLYPVHRLDKETSGVQILALNSRAARDWAELFQTRALTKIYHGILRGKIEEREGVWNDPLSDKAEGRRAPAGLARDRVPCETRYTVVAGNRYFTHCRFNLITGRQHQIRKHCALHRHALVGDSRYGDSRYNAKMREIHSVDRLLLHCAEIERDELKFMSPVPDWQKLTALIE